MLQDLDLKFFGMNKRNRWQLLDRHYSTLHSDAGKKCKPSHQRRFSSSLRLRELALNFLGLRKLSLPLVRKEYYEQPHWLRDADRGAVVRHLDQNGEFAHPKQSPHLKADCIRGAGLRKQRILMFGNNKVF